MIRELIEKPHLILSYLFAFYLLLGIWSRIPLETGLLFVSISMILFFLMIFWIGFLFGSRTGLKKRKVDIGQFFSTIILVLGAIGIISSYLVIGSPTIWVRERNPVWTLSYILFSVGVVSLSKDFRKFIILSVLTMMVCLPSGYRIDFLFPILGSYFRLHFSEREESFWPSFFLILVLVTSLTYKVLSSYISEGCLYPLGYLVTGRAGFTLYSLQRIIEVEINEKKLAFGMYHGKLFLNSYFLDLVIGERELIGPSIGEVTLGWPKSYTSTMIGPILLDLGIVGLVSFSFIMGFLSFVFLRWCPTCYSMYLASLVLWVESGPAHVYLVGSLVLSVLMRWYFGKE